MDLPNISALSKTISANTPIEYLDRLQVNKASNITSKINYLEVISETISNINEN